MIWFAIIIVSAILVFIMVKRKNSRPDLSFLPERFVVFDLETTGLKPDINEVIEIGAIRVNRDSNNHDTFQALVLPIKKFQKITGITGITQEMVDNDGEPLETVLTQFIEFVSDLPLVTFNAEFDMAFLNAAVNKTNSYV